MLTDHITRGGQAVPNDMGITCTSGLPGFAEVLEAAQIDAMLDCVKSTWPETVRKGQAKRSQGTAVD